MAFNPSGANFNTNPNKVLKPSDLKAISEAQNLADLVRSQTPSAQAALAAPTPPGMPSAPTLPTSGVDTILNPFVRPEGVPAGAPTDLSSLFGMGAAGLGPVSPAPMSSPALGAGLPSYDAGMAPTMAPAVSPFAQPQVPPQLAMGQAQGQAITGATTLADLVSRGLGGQVPQMPQAPQIPQLAAQPFAQAMPQAMPQAPVAAPQMAPQAAFPQAPGIAQPAAPSGMASLFAPPPAAPQVQSPQQPYGIPASVQPPVQAANQPQVPPAPSPFQALAPAPAQAAPAPVAPAPVQQAAPAPAPVAQAPAQAPAPARQQPARRGTPLQTDPYAVNPAEDFPEALAARRANQRADDTGNDPGRPYTPTPYERPDEPAPIEQPQEQPAEAPVEPELEPAMAGSPLQNAQPTAPALVNGELMISGGNRRFSRGGPIGDNAGGKGVPTNLLSRVGLTRAILSQFVDRSIVGTMMVPDRPMDNADDVAALAYEYLRKQPQENFMAVILDGQGRPIQILRHTLGSISSTNFVPHVIAGVAASTRGARTVYMVHNHPSTTTRFSTADMLAAQSLSKSIEAIGLRFGGSLVVTDGDAHEGNMTPKYIFHPGGELVEHTPAAMSNNSEGDAQTDARAVHPVIVFDDRPGSDTTTELMVVERTFEIRKDALFPRIKEGKDAIEQIPPLLRNLPGVALMDSAGRLVGVVQMSIGEMRNVSSAGSIIYPSQGQDRDYIGSEDERANPAEDNRVYKRRDGLPRDAKAGSWNNPLAMLMAALERSNAERVIISVGPNEFGQSGNDVRSDAVRNLQKAILRVGGKKVEVLDVINNKQNFPNQVLSAQMYGNYPSPHGPETKNMGGRLKSGQRLGFNEEGAPYGDQGKAPIEGKAPQSLGDVVSQGMERDSLLRSISNIVPDNAVNEEGDIEIDLEEWWAATTDEEKSMLRLIIEDKEMMDDYQDKVTSREKSFVDGTMPIEMAQEYHNMAFTLGLRDWLKSGGDRVRTRSNEPVDMAYTSGEQPRKKMSLVFYDSSPEGNFDLDRQATAIIGPEGVTLQGRYPLLKDIGPISTEKWQQLMDDLEKTGEARIGREDGAYDDLVITSAKDVKEGAAEYGVGETNPDDPNAQADFDRQEREAGARVNPPGITTPSGLDNAKPAEPVIKKTRKPRAKKAPGVNVSAFPKLDATPGVFGRLSGEQMKQFGLSDAMLDQFIEHSTYGQVMSGVSEVKTNDDAAHIVAAMRKRPQEQIVLLITDKNGKPLQIAVHQLGGPASAGFNPGILIGTAASTPGAAKVWFIHNHPSGKSSLSPADLSAGNAVENLCKAANLKYMATMAVAGSQYAVMDNNGAIMGGQKIPPHPRKFSIPLTERIFSYRVSQNTPAFADPAVAGPEMKRIFGESQPGIILADNSNRPVAAIPLDGDVMQFMRAILPGENPNKQTGFAKYAAGVERSGAVNMFIYTADLPMDLAIKVIENMSKVANATKITALDALNSKEVSLNRHIIGYSTDFREPGSSYNAGQDAQDEAEPQSIGDIVKQGLSEPQKKKTRR